MSTILRPQSEEEIADLVRGAAAPLAIRGNGTRQGLGRIVDADTVLSTSACSGITLYEPAEMVMSVRAGTPVSEVEETLAGKGQMLPFEPADHRTLFGTSGEPTFGAIAACNISGPRRIQAGAARDSIIGIRFVNGRGELVKSGGRVMKNVTGLDLVKLSCGAYGSLGVLTEITFKLLPLPESVATLVIEGLDDASAIGVLTEAARSPYEWSGAAHLPSMDGAPPRTLIRIEGFASSVAERLSILRDLFAGRGAVSTLADEASRDLWRKIRDAHPVAEPQTNAVWRISLKPTDGPLFVSAVTDLAGSYFYDWSGGLVWLSVRPEGDAGAARIRAALARLGGHATLIRGPEELRRRVDVFQPLDAALMTLTAGIKRSTDPKRLINPSIMYEGI